MTTAMLIEATGGPLFKESLLFDHEGVWAIPEVKMDESDLTPKP